VNELPDRRVHVDVVAEKVETDFVHFYRKALLGIAIIGLTSAVALGGFAYVLREQNQAQTKACENRNERHDNAINALVTGSNIDQQNAPTEAAKAEIRRRRDVTISLIDAIAPKVDCSDPKQPAVKVKPLN